MTPDWLLGAVAALMLAVAVVSATRLAAAGPWRRGAVVADTDLAHLLMALAMAGMLAPGLRTLPGAGWEAVFGSLAAWFAVRVARDARANGVRALAGGHCAPHFVHCCSMVYMFLAVTAAGAAGMGVMGGMPGAAGTAAVSLRYPALALAFALVLGGYCIWDLDQVSSRRYRLESPRALSGMPARRISGPGVPLPGVPLLAGPQQVSLVVTIPGGAHGLLAPPSPGPRPAAGYRAAVAGRAAAGAGVRAGGASVSRLLAPAVLVACRVAMGAAMAFMLIIAI